MARNRVTVITPVFAPTEALGTLARRCMSATAREFPNEILIMAADYATMALKMWAMGNGWKILEPADGEPPRLKTLLRAAVNMCDTDIFWIIEHDAEICPGTREKVEAQLAAYPETAGIDCLTVDRAGVLCYPSATKLNHPKNFWGLTDCGSHLLKTTQWLSLNCTCWQTRAFRPIRWDNVPEFPACDKGISREMHRLGWTLCMSLYPCIHHCAGARHARKQLS